MTPEQQLRAELAKLKERLAELNKTLAKQEYRIRQLEMWVGR